MKGVSNVITVVMAVIIAAAIMVISFRVLGTATSGIEDIEEQGKTYQQRLAGVQSLSQACTDWLYGDKYEAGAILETYELPNKMRPYSKVSDTCGSDLESVARECYNEQEVTRDCAGNGYIKASITEMTICTKVCSNVILIQQKCEASCSQKTAICFENIVNALASSELRGTVSLDDRTIERACEG